MNDVAQVSYQFGPFQLDSLRCVLTRDGETIPLTPKVFRILLALVEGRGRVIGKEELLKAVWPDTVVEESNLTQNIFVLRKALGESPNDHRYIVTIPGQGYRFVAQVREFSPEGMSATIARFSEQASPPTPSIAILPFTELSSGGDNYMGTGIADVLITRLSGIRQIIVRPTTSVLKYAETGRDPLAAGRELGVETVLDGRIQRADERIRVTVQLLRVSDGVTLWAEKFDERFTDVFTMQDRVAEQVSLALTLKLTREEQQLLTKRYTENTEAFRAYIVGRHLWNKRTPEGLKGAIDAAQAAIDLDPTYALAYVGLADSYNLLAGHGGLAPKETFPKAKAAAMRALEIDDTLAEAYASLGFVSYRYDWDWSKAERNFRRAIELKPNYATGHHWYGEALATEGRFEESLAELHTAQELDPLSLPINTDLGQSLFFARRYDEAIRQISRMLEMNANFARARIIRGAAFEQLGMFDEAIADLRQASALEAGGGTLALSGLGHAYAVTGRVTEARAVIDELKELSRKRYVSAYSIALVHNGLGEYEEALAGPYGAYADRCVWLVWLRTNPRFDRLRSHPQFQELLRRM